MTMMTEMPPIIQVGDVLMSPDIFTECFCCDLDACHGACCVEGDAGAGQGLDVRPRRPPAAAGGRFAVVTG